MYEYNGKNYMNEDALFEAIEDDYEMTEGDWDELDKKLFRACAGYDVEYETEQGESIEIGVTECEEEENWNDDGNR